MKTLTLEQHRKRIENISAAEKDNRVYFRRKRVRDYMPGQVMYHLGDYPARFSVAPTEYDEKLLEELTKNGAELIQVHEEWNDRVRHLGADKFTAFDPEGMQKFVDLCHRQGLKIIPYISSGYFHEYDPDFREEFLRARCYTQGGMEFKYVQCWHGSAYWRDYLLPRTFAAVDKYGFDGIYNDVGHDGWSLAWRKARAEGKDFPEFPYDPELEDLLCTIYSGVKERGGIYKVHYNRDDLPPCKDKIYDYLFIGEGISNSRLGTGKDFPDYVIPWADLSKPMNATMEMDYHFVRTIPFLQFPLLQRGRPVYGACTDVDIPRYGDMGPNSEYGKYLQIKNYMKEHPEGPYAYDCSTTIPPREDFYPLWCKYLALYKPMVEENSLVYMELRDCGEILSALPERICASMFVNEEKYLVVSNLSEEPYTLELRDNWLDRERDVMGNVFTIQPDRMVFLKKLP